MAARLGEPVDRRRGAGEWLAVEGPLPGWVGVAAETEFDALAARGDVGIEGQHRAVGRVGDAGQ